MRLKASRGSEQYQVTKLIDRVFVDSARGSRSEAIENCCFYNDRGLAGEALVDGSSASFWLCAWKTASSAASAGIRQNRVSLEVLTRGERQLEKVGANDGHQQSRDSEEDLRTKMGTRDPKAKLAVLEKALAPAAGLPRMQAEVKSLETSMSAIA